MIRDTMRLSLALAALLAVAGCTWAAAVSSKPVMHPAFKGAGTKAGLLIWRIVSFEPEPVNQKEFGKFYEGDSYIVLSTKEDKSKKGIFSWDIFFWLGSKTSQDESGAAAILSVELDDGLGGGPVQHRETQEHESQLFLSLFKPAGVRYVKGGAATGFHHIEINAAGEKKLYQVKGKKNIRVRQVAPDVKSMNKGDCFILDTGRDIYIYVGAKAKGQERLKAISAANQIRDQDHAGRGKVTVVDSSSTQNEVQQFFTDLGSGSPTQVASEASVDDDLDFEKKQDATVALYKVSDAGGKLVIEKVSQKPLKQSMLKSEDCWVLDTVTSGIFVWIGKQSTTKEKVKALEQGQAFIAANKYPAWTKIQRIVEEAEPSAFREYFAEWRDSQFTGGIGRGSSPSRRIRSVKTSKQCGLATGFMPDNGQGSLNTWRVENFKLEPVKPETHGIFFAGDSYVMKYTYDNGRKFILYFWQGKDSSNDERAVSAIETVRLDNELGGKAMQIRVEQGNEPAHFLKLFHGNLIILNGGVKSGFKNLDDATIADAKGIRLFQIFGSCDDDVRAIQVPHKTSSLNTNDVFLLETPEKAYLWVGLGCNQAEKTFGSRVRSKLCPGKNLEILREGDESDDFWRSLGGKGNYSKEPELVHNSQLDARLFHCYIGANDKFKVEEISDYGQEDLYYDDVMILDSGDVIYVWLGRDSSVEEKTNAHKLVENYVKKLSRWNYTIVTIKQGREPEEFKKIFDSWNDHYWDNLPSLDDIKAGINEIENA